MTETLADQVRLGGETPRDAATRRWRRWRLAVLVVVVLAVTVGLTALIQPPVSEDPLAVDNPGPQGVRALAQVLGDQGVQVHEVRTTSEAVELAEPGTTLAIVSTFLLDSGQLERLAATGADLVLIDPDYLGLEALTEGQVTDAWDVTSTARQAECDDPDAAAAGSVSTLTYAVTLLGEGTVCFPSGTSGVGGYVVLEVGGRTVRVLADSALLTNAHVADQGNAALGLRMFGHHQDLIWYRPSLFAAEDAAADGLFDAVLPPGAAPVAAALGFVVLVAAIWRGRALGRVVTEPLPVTVRAAEATRGRGRLYRRARSRGHAAAALRAATARRTALRLGLSHSADAPTMIEAVSSATGRPTQEVAALLYGPPPSDDAGLLALTGALDQLESEVHRT